LVEAILYGRSGFAVARQHALGRLQFTELARELLALRIDAGECLAES
jgi:hypothetical protein